MAFQEIIKSVPEFYQPFLPKVFYKEIPTEPFAICLNCPMVAKNIEEISSETGRPFSPATKCCTFVPRLPNYLVGAILSDKDPAMKEGKRRIIERIRSFKGIFPNGVYPTSDYNREYHEKCRTDFGRNERLLCPFFLNNEYNCSIWKYREAVCALWFCKHLAGIKGTEFWNSVISYMKFLQEWLLNIAAERCGLMPVDPYDEGNYRGFREFSGEEAEGGKYSDIWKHWTGHEIEYYVQCYEVVSNLDHSEIENIMNHGEILAKRIEDLASEIMYIPEIMDIDKDRIIKDQDENYIVEISSHIEVLQKSIVWSFSFPKLILDSFDGMTKTSRVIENLLEYGIKIEPEILIALYRQDILQDVPE